MYSYSRIWSIERALNISKLGYFSLLFISLGFSHNTTATQEIEKKPTNNQKSRNWDTVRERDINCVKVSAPRYLTEASLIWQKIFNVSLTFILCKTGKEVSVLVGNLPWRYKWYMVPKQYRVLSVWYSCTLCIVLSLIRCSWGLGKRCMCVCVISIECINETYVD